MSVRLMWSKATGQHRDWQLLKEFETEEAAKARAEVLSGAYPRALPSWASSSGAPARGFEYQRGDEAWLVEVDL